MVEGGGWRVDTRFKSYENLRIILLEFDVAINHQ
jgi:hypothetical protein